MSEKLREKFPATTPNCSMVKIGHLDNSFLEKEKKRKGEKWKGKNIQKSKSLKT